MKKRYLIPLILLAVSLVMTGAGRLIPAFADFYAENVFPYISAPFAWVSGLLPVSLGELIVIAGILLVIIGLPVMIVMLIVKKKSRRRTLGFAMTTFLWALTYVMVTETLNCFTLYGCTRFSERYFDVSAQHTDEQLVELYRDLVMQANELALEVPRDSDNRFELSGDPMDACREAMHNISGDYPQLKGYYPDAKPIMFSFFMSQSNLLGMYIPFSMEATYNRDMVRTNLPSTICHEYSHLKGYMQEDEANFISFIATMSSDDPQVRYSGVLDALGYVHNQVVESNIYDAVEVTGLISEEVRNDWFRFLPDNYWEDNEDKEILPTDTVSSVSTEVSDASMKLNGVEDGIKSYSRMVDLMLDYYYSD